MHVSQKLASMAPTREIAGICIIPKKYDVFPTIIGQWMSMAVYNKIGHGKNVGMLAGGMIPPLLCPFIMAIEMRRRIGSLNKMGRGTINANIIVSYAT